MKKEPFGTGIFTILFLISLFAYAGLSAYKTIPQIVEEINRKKIHIESSAEIKETIGIVDNHISEDAYYRYNFIEVFGMMNKIVGKTEINGFDYALDEYGGYVPVSFLSDLDNMDYKEVALRVCEMKEDAEKNGAHFMYIQSPNKIDDAWNSGISGIPYDAKNGKTDKLLAWFERYGIDVLDFRESLANSGMSYQEMFYNTDHHWTGVAAFYAYTDLVQHMHNEYDEGLDSEHFYTDISNYDVSYYSDTYLGSAGRDIGFSFGKCNDYMQMVVPKFDGNIMWSGYSGDYEDTVFRYDKLRSDNKYKADAYGFYLYGVLKQDEIVNNANPDGLRILFIRDSFMSPVIIDMIPFCSQIDAYWGLYVDEDTLRDKIANGNYDYVILSYGVLNIEEENFGFYYPKETEDEVEEAEAL